MHPQLDQAITKVDAFIAKYPNITQYDKLKQLEDKTGYPKVYFFLGGAALLVGFLTLLGGAKLIVDLLGFVYPAYMSFKSMDGNSAEDTDDTQWLTYWVIFSFLNISENLLGFLVDYIPLYFWLKIGIIVWMYYPTTRGAQKIYEQVLRPIVLPYLDMLAPSGGGVKTNSGASKKD